jgi:DNA repair exonuclease SbcCD nuclease subunit
MAKPSIKILFIADTHLGFDLPLSPRVKRRRRGIDFFQNFRKALEPALTGKVDFVVHGGDLFYRSRVPAAHIIEAFKPIICIAKTGIPFFIVPGNHERSKIPENLFVRHHNIFIFDKPKTVYINVKGIVLSLSGFPYCRNDIRSYFTTLLQETSYNKNACDAALLCIHQAVEGAKVGTNDYTFKYGQDVIKGEEIPGSFAAVLSGHIHRAQLLRTDLYGNPLAAPVLYDGSIERTSFAERMEKKGYYVLTIKPDGTKAGHLESYNFTGLPARPMHSITINLSGLGPTEIRSKLIRALSGLDTQSIVRVKTTGYISDESRTILNAGSLRSLVPSTMNIGLAIDFSRGTSRRYHGLP